MRVALLCLLLCVGGEVANPFEIWEGDLIDRGGGTFTFVWIDADYRTRFPIAWEGMQPVKYFLNGLRVELKDFPVRPVRVTTLWWTRDGKHYRLIEVRARTR